MGVTFDTLCVKCGESAPEVGDCGYIGFPSASRERGPVERIANFGYIYEGLETIGLRTWSLDALYDFLTRHEGHGLHTFGDGEPAFGDGDPEALAAAQSESDENDDFDDFDADDDFDEDDGWNEEVATAYPAARYRVECSACSEQFQSEFGDNLKALTSTVLSAPSIDAFLERVVQEIDREAFYRSEPLSGDDLERLAAFLAQHRTHSPVASSVPEER